MQLALIVPCYNEASRLKLQYWEEILNNNEVTLFFVDDGSTDNTLFELNKLTYLMNCHIVSVSRNMGKANAIRHGMQHVQAVGKYSDVGFIDADGAFELGDIKRFIERWKINAESSENFDALWSSRVKLAGRKIERNELRHYISRVIATYFSTTGIDLPYDTQCGFKIFKNNTDFQTALIEPFITRWFFDLELLSRVLRINKTFRIYEEPLNSWQDVSGSKINTFETLRIMKEIRLMKKFLGGI
jgi:glycosyltransferase involved in cell wall biosynthesis